MTACLLIFSVLRAESLKWAPHVPKSVLKSSKLSLTTGFPSAPTSRKEPEGKTQRVKTSENFAEEKSSQRIFQKIPQKIEEITFIVFKVFLAIFQIFAEDCFLLKNVGSVCPLGIYPEAVCRLAGACAVLQSLDPNLRSLGVSWCEIFFVKKCLRQLVVSKPMLT